MTASVLLKEARHLLEQADSVAAKLRARGRRETAAIRVGAIDSAAAGLLPMLLQDFRRRRPDVTVKLAEDKTIRLLPRLLSGRLDLALVRPPEKPDRRLEFLFLLYESAVVAVSERHPLASRKRVTVADLAEQPLIVPERRSRPHSHDLTMKLFARAGLPARVAQLADEKQTIVNLVAAGLGVAIVPRWTSRMAARGVRYVPLKAAQHGRIAAGGGLDPRHARSRAGRDAGDDQGFAEAVCEGGVSAGVPRTKVSVKRCSADAGVHAATKISVRGSAAQRE